MSVFDDQLARRLMRLRQTAGLSLDELAGTSGISRASLSRLERGESSPTAATLGRLCSVFSIPMAHLFADLDAVAKGLLPLDEQEIWIDADTGFRRRSVSPAQPGYKATVIEGVLPSGQEISYTGSPIPDLEHHLVLLEGKLEISLDTTIYALNAGDCIRFQLTGTNSYRAPGPELARYLLCVIAP